MLRDCLVLKLPEAVPDDIDRLARAIGHQCQQLGIDLAVNEASADQLPRASVALCKPAAVPSMASSWVGRSVAIVVGDVRADGWTSEFERLIDRAGIVLATEPSGQLLGGVNQRPFARFQLGYCALWDPHLDTESNRDVPAVIWQESVGSTNEREFADFLAAGRRWDARLIDDAAGVAGANGPGGLDEQRPGGLLSRARVAVMFHGERPSSHWFQWSRYTAATLAGAAVVAQSTRGWDPLLPGRDLLLGSPEGLPGLVQGLLEDPSRCRLQAARAYHTLRTELHMRRPVAELVRSGERLLWEPTPTQNDGQRGAATA